LLMVLIFVLSVFFLTQFFLSQLVTGQDEMLTILQNQLEQTQEDLSASQIENQDLQNRLDALYLDLEAVQTELEHERLSTEETLALLDAAEREITILEREIASLNSDLVRARADRAIQQNTETDLRTQLAELQTQLQHLQELLAASEAEIDVRDIEIVNLQARLNQALIREVEELARYRSEFFGRLRDILGDRNDIRVVGDRFVFQSEVLFDSGSAELAEGGKEELARLADTLLIIIDDLPDDLNWIIRVDGHTDARPINTPEFPSNWELSTARATEVVRFLIAQGLPENRLAATGFGAFHPLEEGENLAAYRRNRRIEIKFDQR